MQTVHIETINKDNDLPSKVAYLTVKSKRVITPRRSLCLTMDRWGESHRILNPKIRGINEIPRRLNKEIVMEIDSDVNKQEEFYSDIERRFRTPNTSDEISVFLYTYENGSVKTDGKVKIKEPNHTPTETETEYLCGLLNHIFNDVWVPPVVPNLSGTAYRSYLEHFYEFVNSHHRVPVAGLIPHVSRLDIRRLAELYIKYGLNYFVLDFAGKNPFALYGNIMQTVDMLKTIEKETGTPCFLHGINVPFYRGLWENKVILARDILLFGLGFDCFGSNHYYKPRKLPDDVRERMKTQRRRYRLFNRKDYGYYRYDSLKESDYDETEPTVVSIKDFHASLGNQEIGHYETLFNVERQGLEADEIRTRLIERRSLLKHFKSKPQLTGVAMNRIVGSK